MTKEAKHKRDFRASGKWKKFRNHMKKLRKVDEVTGSPLYSGWQCHHLDMRDEHYEELYENKFSCLNRKSHDFIHWLFRYKNWREVLNNISNILERMEEYR